MNQKLNFYNLIFKPLNYFTLQTTFGALLGLFAMGQRKSSEALGSKTIDQISIGRPFLAVLHVDANTQVEKYVEFLYSKP